MALTLTTAYKGIPLPTAYVRIVGVESSRDQDISAVRYGVWASAADAVVVYPDRSELDQAETELLDFISTQGDSENYQMGLDYRNNRIRELKRNRVAATHTTEPPLELFGEQFPYSADMTVAMGYIKIKTLPKFADAIDA